MPERQRENRWGRIPSIGVKELHQLLPRYSRILDIGAGYGRDTLYLALQGHYVKAIDSDNDEIKQLEARKGYLSIDTCHADFTDLEVLASSGTPWDAIIAIASLHFVGQRAEAVIDWMQENTRPNGYNAISVILQTKYYNDRGDVIRSSKSPLSEAFPDHWLADKYHGWTGTCRERWGQKETHREQGVLHDHYMIDLLMQKV